MNKLAHPKTVVRSILWKTCVKLRGNHRGNPAQIFVEIFHSPSSTWKSTIFSHFFPQLSTTFPTTTPPLFVIRLFHYSTAPTTITTKII